MKTPILLALLMLSSFSVFAEVIVDEQGKGGGHELVRRAAMVPAEIEQMRDFYDDNRAYTPEDFQTYVETVQFIKRRGYNMGPYSKYGIMKGMPIPTVGNEGRGGGRGGRGSVDAARTDLNWGPCPRSAFSQSRTDWEPTRKPGWYRNPAYAARNWGSECARLR